MLSSNQPPPLEDTNLFSDDVVLREGWERFGQSVGVDDLKQLGEAFGSGDARRAGTLANSNPPVLHTHDRYGDRLDRVDFHPAWHQLMALSTNAGLHSSPWETDPASHVHRAIGFHMSAQIEAGHGCPISMTYAVVPALRNEPEVAADWIPLVTQRRYDPSFRPAGEKQAVLFGMGMTERQGGSDVRANTTTAVPTANDAEYVIVGHKWFTSAPMNDAFLILAQAPEGLTCLLLPRWRPDGTKNAMHLVRLKDKLGNRSNASAEVEFDSAWAVRVGEPGRGIPTIVDMVNHTRLDCVIGSAGLMRRAVAEAVHHTRHRWAFGSALIDKPLMRSVLADLLVESEAASWLMLRLAATYDSPALAPLRRIGTPIAKYWVCKRAPVVIGEALECLGGNGFIEDSGLPRLFRESPLNSIWEGSGNVICLDVLRAARREPSSAQALVTEIETGRGFAPQLDSAIDRAVRGLDSADEAQARRVVEQLAIAWQAAILVNHAPAAVAEMWVATKLSPGHTIGAAPSADPSAMLDRAPA